MAWIQEMMTLCERKSYAEIERRFTEWGSPPLDGITGTLSEEFEDITFVDAVLFDVENFHGELQELDNCIRFLQSHGSRVSEDFLMYASPDILSLSELIEGGLTLALDHIDMTDIGADLGDNSHLYTSMFEFYITEKYREAGESAAYLRKLRPLIDAGMKIYPFDGRRGPPDHPPAPGINDPRKTAVVSLLWPSDDAQQSIDFDWPPDELRDFRCSLDAALETEETRRNRNWQRRRDILLGIRLRSERATGLALFFVDLFGSEENIGRRVFSFI